MANHKNIHREHNLMMGVEQEPFCQSPIPANQEERKKSMHKWWCSAFSLLLRSLISSKSFFDVDVQPFRRYRRLKRQSVLDSAIPPSQTSFNTMRVLSSNSEGHACQPSWLFLIEPLFSHWSLIIIISSVTLQEPLGSIS